jgi:hypothetical protein
MLLSRCCWSAVLSLALAAQAGADALQIDTPWQTSGSNTGRLGALGVSASASHWGSDFGDQSSIYANAAFGALALAGTIGDFLRIDLDLASARTDTLRITLSDPLVDPIFYVIDPDGVGATITVTPGGTVFTTNADSVWAGDVLTVTSGFIEGTAGGLAAVQYAGAFASGSVFTFALDYSAVPAALQADSIGFGVALAAPEPHAALLLAGAVLTSLISRRRRV